MAWRRKQWRLLLRMVLSRGWQSKGGANHLLRMSCKVILCCGIREMVRLICLMMTPIVRVMADDDCPIIRVSKPEKCLLRQSWQSTLIIKLLSRSIGFSYLQKRLLKL
ncbi:hypothetical protein MANES_18G112320v8 [Manihot esculenta]|uniref:Uncharacterized protein n=1 Tax=Manihot esculenta TaxID=3983 RepID=A0A2C9U2C7_MANES|nr:hypothetical protein MANES_18G112320v8 [Manihot esculenta]